MTKSLEHAAIALVCSFQCFEAARDKHIKFAAILGFFAIANLIYALATGWPGMEGE